MKLRSIAAAVICASLMLVGPVAAQTADEVRQLKSAVQALQGQVAALQSQLAALQASGIMAAAPYVSVVKEPINGLAGPHLIFTGANVHVRDGSQATAGSSGRGNLIVGYNELPTYGQVDAKDREGTHNLVVGSGHRYTYFGGFVAGHENSISGLFATVSGGFKNSAKGEYSSVSGGESNVASAYYTSVSGGGHNVATGYWSWIGGGQHNASQGGYSSVTGGQANISAGGYANISGGYDNLAFAAYSVVTGGEKNQARGPYSSVAGGKDRKTGENWQWVGGPMPDKN
jgi:outer membrane murein-binding lipoprotein Lpp